MKFKSSLLALVLPVSCALIVGCAATRPSDVNYGDGSVGNLMYEMNHANEAGQPEKALIYADKLIKDYTPEAKVAQASLGGYPPDMHKYEYRALMGVGLALWVKGNILANKGDKAGALEALNTLVNDFKYAQYQSYEGEVRRPAEDARQKIEELKAGMS
ncbi:MAG: hypothetical protein E4H19_07985 [Chromatiales bacterium]|jgi:hypothetical protein|nr:MAG: hypothetical protein E4H19_07985 [Chromatiales bacterium]